MAKIRVFVLNDVAKRIKDGKQTNSFVVHPEETDYVRRRRRDFTEMELDARIIDEQKSTGCRYQPKEERG